MSDEKEMNSGRDFMEDDLRDDASPALVGIDVGDLDLKLSDDLLAEALKVVDMSSVSAGTLASDMGNLLGAQPTEQGVAKPAGIGLPSSKPTGLGLPTPKPVGSGLPSPKSMEPGLPTPKPVGAGLPSPKSAEPGLPTPKSSGAGLASPKSTEPGLPTPKPVGGGLPSPKPTEPGLPTPKPVVAGLPSPKSMEPGLPTPKPAGVGLPKPKIVPPSTAQRHATMAFSPRKLDPIAALEPNGQGKSPEELSLDIPKLKFSDEARQPVLKLDHEAPTGAFSQSNDFDDNSGLPLADDPLGLIGAPSVPHGLAASPAPEVPESVFFAETQLPLQNQAPEPQEDILGLFEQPEVSSVAVPLLANAAPNAPSADMPQPPNAAIKPTVPPPPSPIKAPQGFESEEAASEESEELVFDVKSIQSGGSATAPVKVLENSKQIDRRKSQRRRRVIRICSIVVIVLLIGVAALLYAAKLSPDTSVNTVIDFDQSKIDVRWELMFADRDTSYLKFFKLAVERLGQADVSNEEKAELQGKSLIDVVLASTLDASIFSEDDVAMLDASAKAIRTTCVSEWCATGLYSWGMFRQNEDLVAAYKHKVPKEGDLASITELVGISAAFYQWKLEDQTYAERIAYGEKILGMIGSKFDGKKYPIAARLKAETLMRIGRFEEAYDLVSKLRTDNGEPLSPALALVEFDVDTALERVDSSEPLLTYLESIRDLSASNKKALAIRKLQYSASTTDKVDFFKSLEEFVTTHVADPVLVDAGVRMCSYLQAYTECRMMLTKVLKTSSGNLDVLTSLVAVSIYQQGISEIVRPDRVLSDPVYSAIDEVLAKGLNADPQRRQLWKLNAALQYAAGKDEEAIKAFDEIERGESIVWFGAFLRQLMDYKQTDDVEKREKIVRQLVAWGKDVWKPQDAITLAQALQYVGKTTEAKELINRVHELFPALSDVLRVRFDLALETKDLALAEDSLFHLKKHNALRYEDEYHLARLIEELGDENRALEQMLDLIGRMSDKNAEFLLYVGELFFKQGRCDSASPYFEQSIEVNANLPKAHFLRGRCLYEDGKFEEALAEFTEAGTQDEDNHSYALWTGLVLLKVGQDNDASLAFSTVIENVQKIAPEARQDIDIDNAAQAYYQRGLLRKVGRKRSEAFDDFEKAIALRPNEPLFREGYIVGLYENGRLPECAKQIEALHAIPEVKVDARVLFIEGVIALKANRREEALEKFEQALANGFAEREDSGIIGVRESVEIYERLGYLYRDLGKREEARKYLNLLLEKSKALSPSAKHDIQNDIDKI